MYKIEERLLHIRELELQKEDEPLTPNRLSSLRQIRLDIHEIYRKGDYEETKGAYYLVEGGGQEYDIHPQDNKS